MAESVKNNALLRQFFQVGNESDDDEEAEGTSGGGGGGQEAGAAAAGGGAAADGEGRLTAEHLSQLMWDQISASLDAEDPYLPDISAPLRAVAEQVEEELSTCQLPLLADTCLDELKPFSRQALQHLALLGRILDLEPPPILTTYSRSQPVPTVGTHRAAVAELLSQLLRSECPSVASAVAASGLLPRCTALAVSHPNCNALHCSVVRCLRHALSDACGEVGLWRTAVGAASLAAAGSSGKAAAGCSGAGAAAAAGADDGARECQELAAAVGGKPCLATYAAGIARGVQGTPAGRRSPHVGFALATADLLQTAAAGGSVAPPPPERATPSLAPSSSAHHLVTIPGPPPAPAPDAAAASEAAAAAAAEAEAQRALRATAPWRQELRGLLGASSAWAEFSSAAGPLPALLGEQQGDLGGPRPGKYADGPGEEEDMGGHIISGQELLMMLRGLNMGFSA